MSKTILNISLRDLRGAKLSIEPFATPGRIRLIRCSLLVDNGNLVLEEFTDFPSVTYSAISYVWKGNTPDPATQHRGEVLGHFTVKGAEDGDPISIDVLRDACLAVQCFNIDYIWLDRVCIMQKNQDDKAWQITQMFNLYQQAEFTIILPGGIHHLVPLNEETSWVHRGWTLQEALAPDVAYVLHLWEWEHGAVGDQDDEDTKGDIQVVVPGRCAFTDLANLVEACTLGNLRWAPKALCEDEGEWRTEPTRILGHGTSNLHAFLDALRVAGSPRSIFRDYAIWKAALTRTSSRPVDMVFSIMGLFDVTLDPRAFKKDDRIGTTIALAREILRKGGSASWIGISTRAPPCRHLSTFPEFPETSVGGKALIRTTGKIIDAANIVDDDTYMAATGVFETFESSQVGDVEGDGFPYITGEMDETGYLTFRRAACTLTPTNTADVKDCVDCQRTTEALESRHLSAQAVDGTRWFFHEGADLEVSKFQKFFAVALGPFATVSLSDEHDEHFKFMLVQEHAPERFHIVSFFVLPNWDKNWSQKVLIWKETRLSVGGPDRRGIF